MKQLDNFKFNDDDEIIKTNMIFDIEAKEGGGLKYSYIAPDCIIEMWVNGKLVSTNRPKKRRRWYLW